MKTSRLETGVITLEKKETAIADTLVDAINGVLAPMERKHLHLSVNCPENLTVAHDSRWTSEALFNLLDNAVKYTPEGGDIHVTVQDWEMYLEIAVTDTGRGIPESVQATIFKRFYREEAVHDVDGIGIGLYLAREIITMQGGYITVESEVRKGSTFYISSSKIMKRRSVYSDCLLKNILEKKNFRTFLQHLTFTIYSSNKERK